jgi:hypothetical protein
VGLWAGFAAAVVYTNLQESINLDGQVHGALAGLNEVGNHPLRAIETSLNASDFMAGSSTVPAVEATVGGLCGPRIDVPIRPVTR